MKTTIGCLFAKLLILFISLLIFSCKKEDATPAETCRVSAIDRGNGNTHAYTYDADGKVTIMTRELFGHKAIYTLTYDKSGILESSKNTFDGIENSTERYTYFNNKITTVNITFDGGKGINKIKYDSDGRMSEFSYEFGDPNNDGVQSFEYDTNGILIKSSFKDLQGNKLFELIIKPVGIVKSPEQLLSNNGLPFDILVGNPWATVRGGVGTTYESFTPDSKGKLVSDGIDKTTNIKLDAKGYISESTTIDNANASSISKFTLINYN